MDELDFFRGRRVLITGHTGFKGSWLSLWLQLRGAVVSGYSSGIPTNPSLFEVLGLAKRMHHHLGDVRDDEGLTRVMERERPEIVFHLAAQPLVRRSHERPKETFDVNVGGTVNLLEAVRRVGGVRVVIGVTSDKCYDNQGNPRGFRESDPLGGSDPYSASKAAAELVVAAYRESFFTSKSAAPVGLATVRAGNVIGGGDWAADRLVPDCIRALVSGKPVVVRHPEAVRPWQHVLEPLAGYLVLATRLWDEPHAHAGAWNFGPPASSSHPVAELVEELLRQWGSGSWQGLEDLSAPGPGEADCLRLCSDKAQAHLSWKPRWTFASAIRRTVTWYRTFYQQIDARKARALCCRQIRRYERRGCWSFSQLICEKRNDRGGRAGPQSTEWRKKPY